MAKQKNLYRDHHFNQIKTGWNVVFSIILCLISLLMLIPLLLIVVVSFSSEASIALNGFSFFPTEWTLVGYKYLAKMGDQILISYRITIIITILGTLMSLFVMTMYAYVLAQKNFVFRKFFMWILFFTMLFSGGLVPWYLLITNYLKLKDTYLILILTQLVNVFYVILMKNFMKTVPKALIEAAKIDGAGEFYIFFRIVLPLVKPALASIGMFTALNYWNEWRTGMLFLQNSDLFPLQYYLYRLLNSVEFLKSATVAMSSDISSLDFPSESLKLAMTVIATGPIICLYPFLQKYFVKGITIGAVKG